MELKHQLGLILFIVGFVIGFHFFPWYGLGLVILGAILSFYDKIPEHPSIGPAINLIKFGVAIALLVSIVPTFLAWAGIEIAWESFLFLGLLNSFLLYIFWHMGEGKSLEEIKKKVLEEELKYIKEKRGRIRKKLEGESGEEAEGESGEEKPGEEESEEGEKS
jgi:membrane protein implicated in regulation of membrane protease activity